jgi:hypothetical protein
MVTKSISSQFLHLGRDNEELRRSRTAMRLTRKRLSRSKQHHRLFRDFRLEHGR